MAEQNDRYGGDGESTGRDGNDTQEKLVAHAPRLTWVEPGKLCSLCQNGPFGQYDLAIGRPLRPCAYFGRHSTL